MMASIFKLNANYKWYQKNPTIILRASGFFSLLAAEDWQAAQNCWCSTSGCTAIFEKYFSPLSPQKTKCWTFFNNTMKLQIFFQHCLFSDHKTEVVVVRLLTGVHILTRGWWCIVHFLQIIWQIATNIQSV